MSGEEVDVAVAEDHAEAERIYERLKSAGIHHVELWPEHMLEFHLDLRIAHAYPQDHIDPFHIMVRPADAAQAQLILSTPEPLEE